ncbi:hypothetical protein [Butyricicoccus porcorum]|uniref:Uncharacterized protein n=1 Tax=Butyricicoccus porcorum TaxID=1945634 RepID=A0A252F6W5_9FIRM|nr:hypothetical protein [Butyricicoccus porcorum]MCI6925521.1 hypothetical protein [Butyricicoccus porcorum]MDY4483642.1 hypothetical protein [Butyricicoccus porcorum]OUM21400.1 hypothetical protein CBW42_02170 [Butyricicoccus porcorum]
MQSKTKTLTFCAMMTALGILFLMMGSMMPGMWVAFTAIAGVVAALTVVQGNLAYGLLTVIATALLSALIVPAKEIALLYAAFFGPYTLVKNLIERLHNLPLEWVLKLLFCGIVSALLFLFADSVLAMVPAVLASHIWLFLPAVLFVFAAYDIVFSKLIVYLFQRLHI